MTDPSEDVSRSQRGWVAPLIVVGVSAPALGPAPALRARGAAGVVRRRRPLVAAGPPLLVEPALVAGLGAAIRLELARTAGRERARRTAGAAAERTRRTTE